MRAPGHRRQVLLFLAAILAPCLLLVGLSLRMIGQERELAEKRRSDERRLVANRIRQELLARLERIKLEEAGAARRLSSQPPPPEVALVAWLRDGKLAMPWETEKPEARFTGAFGEALREGERLEFVAGSAAAALPHYQRALREAGEPGERAYARLLRARALEKTGRTAEALADFRVLLAVGQGIHDEEGVPLQLLAAERLAGAGADRTAVLEATQRALNGRQWLPPTACYTASIVGDKLGAAELKAEVAARIRRTGQALGLEADYARLGLRDGVWVTYGEDPWLVSAVPGIMVIAVRAADVFGAFATQFTAAEPSISGLRFLTSGQTGGELLGESFPGLKAAFTVTSDGVGLNREVLQRRFTYAVMLVVLCAALYGAYLLWRDLNREMQLAGLQAQFVSNVSHELKTPLTAIRMFAETLQMGRSRDAEAQTEYLDTIVSECERLSRLVDGVLTFSKMEQGKKTYRFRPVKLADSVRAAARAMEYPLRQHGFELRVDVDDALPPVRADHDAIEQAVLNLLSNAMKYSGERREIELRVLRINGDAAIQVRDYGLGIAAAEQGRIFEKFYRAATPENQHIPGTGLGLTLVAQIVRAHSGRVEVQSAPGEGSTFSIRLPLESGAAAEKASV
ncbi:MAG TPA: ATP-binding protein [Bryobacteraceae bacterium]|nr:ATP-binding protein [Bryobacteraceae bacterium]